MPKPPFFIHHDSRSGSTFLADRLMKCTNALVLPESNFLIPILRRTEGEKKIRGSEACSSLLDQLLQEEKFRDLGLDRERLLKIGDPEKGIHPRDLVESIACLYAPEIEEGTPWGFKKGNYAFHFPFIDKLFPNALHITIVRDGRAIFLSKKKNINPDLGKPFETDPKRAAKTWVRYQKAFRRIHKEAPQRAMTVHYERLVEDPDNEIERIRSFVGADKSEEERGEEGFYIPERYQRIHRNVGGAKPQKDRASAWEKELDPSEISEFEQIAHRELRRAGYHPLHSGLSLTLQKIGASFRSSPSREENP